MAEGKVIGGFIVWVFDHGHNILGTIFVDPTYQDHGVATRTWHFIEAMYPATKSWTLETPAWAVKNHHFYEAKCRFHKVEAREDQIIFKKEMEFS